MAGEELRLVCSGIVANMDVVRSNYSGPFCRVEGCTREISSEKSYYRRYHICEEHMKRPALLVDGRPQRFCQQCAKLQDCTEFDGARKSCRTKLKCHTARRKVALKEKKLAKRSAMSDGEDCSDDDGSILSEEDRDHCPSPSVGRAAVTSSATTTTRRRASAAKQSADDGKAACAGGAGGSSSHHSSGRTLEALIPEALLGQQPEGAPCGGGGGGAAVGAAGAGLGLGFGLDLDWAQASSTTGQDLLGQAGASLDAYPSIHELRQQLRQPPATAPPNLPPHESQARRLLGEPASTASLEAPSALFVANARGCSVAAAAGGQGVGQGQGSGMERVGGGAEGMDWEQELPFAAAAPQLLHHSGTSLWSGPGQPQQQASAPGQQQTMLQHHSGSSMLSPQLPPPALAATPPVFLSSGHKEPRALAMLQQQMHLQQQEQQQQPNRIMRQLQEQERALTSDDNLGAALGMPFGQLPPHIGVAPGAPAGLQHGQSLHAQQLLLHQRQQAQQAQQVQATQMGSLLDLSNAKGSGSGSGSDSARSRALLELLHGGTAVDQVISELEAQLLQEGGMWAPPGKSSHMLSANPSPSAHRQQHQQPPMLLRELHQWQQRQRQQQQQQQHQQQQAAAEAARLEQLSMLPFGAGLPGWWVASGASGDGALPARAAVVPHSSGGMDRVLGPGRVLALGGVPEGLGGGPGTATGTTGSCAVGSGMSASGHHHHRHAHDKGVDDNTATSAMAFGLLGVGMNGLNMDGLAGLRNSSASGAASAEQHQHQHQRTLLDPAACGPMSALVQAQGAMTLDVSMGGARGSSAGGGGSGSGGGSGVAEIWEWLEREAYGEARSKRSRAEAQHGHELQDGPLDTAEQQMFQML